jgi:hypothetical protein
MATRALVLQVRSRRPYTLSVLMIGLMLILVLLVKAPAAHACTCVNLDRSVGDRSASARIERADLAFDGKLVEIRQIPNPYRKASSLWTTFLTEGWRGVLTAWVMRSMEPAQVTKYVFDTIQTIKGEPLRSQALIDATLYSSSCAGRPPDFTAAIGKTLRVVASRRVPEDPNLEPTLAASLAPEYVVYFSVCGSPFEVVSDSPAAARQSSPPVRGYAGKFTG